MCLAVYSANRNLILWSYSLVRDMDVWKQELLSLTADARVLFIKGTKDWVSIHLIPNSNIFTTELGSSHI